eukprot:CAMPEP_0118641078 /NCGR_PEP_ID=MMETSP0785-20121206/5089_1 /TAXON_ID=91992 /ORGANISM="Bolidomonas pacifica, Strain CCMP 1866" /LENGTH=58 /DNA_ID=CAMNT_0006532497 /DNA_START=226 /DNA_END=399 /DNA_ORIENTATION=+
MAFPINVFPVPGGPNSKSPLAAALKPVNKSGRVNGHMTISNMADFADFKPEIEEKVIW